MPVPPKLRGSVQGQVELAKSLGEDYQLAEVLHLERKGWGDFPHLPHPAVSVNCLDLAVSVNVVLGL